MKPGMCRNPVCHALVFGMIILVTLYQPVFSQKGRAAKKADAPAPELVVQEHEVEGVEVALLR